MKEANVAVEWAMEIADSLPERYQEAAFAELLRHALRCELNPPNASLDTSEGTMPTPATGSWQEEVIAGLPEDHLLIRS